MPQIQTSRIFRPTLRAGLVYARIAGSASALQSIGGVESLEISIDEDVKKQADYSRAGGGTRAQVNRVKAVGLKAKLQDLNPVNLARAVFGETANVVGATVVDEPVVAYKGGLVRLAHINPASVVVKTTAQTPVTVAMAGNYEVRPEGLFVLDNAPDITDGQALKVSYTATSYDVVEALTTTAPTLEMIFAGVNEAGDGASSTVDLYRVRIGAVKKLGLIDKDFAELDIEGEVLMDPTKTGAGVSKFFKVRMQ